ncbi:MAG: superoxide dismutase [Candidatus Cyclobacteriaceae bacterium M3_2C_046]
MTVRAETNQNIFKLPILAYQTNDLEPYFDSETMEIHYGRHHKKYVSNFIAEIESFPQLKDSTFEEILSNISRASEKLRNNAGGHFNHTLFWSILSPAPVKTPSGRIEEALTDQFGSIANFKQKFEEVSLKHFGSGWSWLVLQEGHLEIGSTPNQDNPLMDVSSLKGIPLLGLDLWEHAYYLKYQNQRGEYIKAFWNVLDWNAVGKKYIDNMT